MWIEDLPIIIVGTKADLKSQKIVDFYMAREWATAKGCSLIETSSKTPCNVEEVFHTLTAAVLAKKVAQTLAQSIEPQPSAPQQDDSRSGNCCVM